MQLLYTFLYDKIGPDCTCATADIAILVETRPNNYLSFGKTRDFLKKMFEHITKLRYRLKFLNIRRPRSYQEYTRKLFNNQLNELSKGFYKSMYPYQNILKRVEKAINNEMTEDFDSFSRYKVVIVITEKAIDAKKLRRIERVYREEVTIINIAQRMNYKALPLPSGARVGRDMNFAQFGLDQAEKAILYVQASDGNIPCL